MTCLAFKCRPSNTKIRRYPSSQSFSLPPFQDISCQFACSIFFPFILMVELFQHLVFSPPIIKRSLLKAYTSFSTATMWQTSLCEYLIIWEINLNLGFLAVCSVSLMEKSVTAFVYFSVSSYDDLYVVALRWKLMQFMVYDALSSVFVMPYVDLNILILDRMAYDALPSLFYV